MELLGFTLDATTVAFIFIVCAFIGGMIVVGSILFFSYLILYYLFSFIFSSKEEIRKGKVIKLEANRGYYSHPAMLNSTSPIDDFSPVIPPTLAESIVATEYLMLFKDESTKEESTFKITPEAFQELKEQESFYQDHNIFLHLKRYIFGIRSFDFFCFEADPITVTA